MKIVTKIEEFIVENLSLPKIYKFNKFKSCNIVDGESTLLNNSENLATIVEYIRKINPNFQELKLIYKASRDGFEAKQFHLKCNEQGPTLTVAKVNIIFITK